MSPDNNWLSFSLSPMEMLTTTNSQTQQYYYNDNTFYTNGWNNEGKTDTMYSGDNSNNNVNEDVNNNIKETDDSPMFRSFMESHINQQQAPKLEDFLGGETQYRYGDVSQTETQDSSSLTHMYEGTGGGGTMYLSHEQSQDLNGMGGYHTHPTTFSANSGSEVDDSSAATGANTHMTEFAGQSIESGNELAYVQCPMNALSLGIVTSGGGGPNQDQNQKAIVAVDSNENNNSNINNNGCKKIADTFGQRTSIYRGVTRHRWTGRYEAHLWDNSCRREGQARKGRQVYLGGYDKEDKAARAYDLAALKYWGPTATTNFPVASYAQELEDMKHATKQEFIASLRRKSSGFSRGASIYRGVTRHHQQGRWQARIGRVAGNKDLYLGTFTTEEEAAEAYDIAAIKFRGVNAVTNFEMNRYDVEAISSSSLPVGGSAKRLKVNSSEVEQKPALMSNQQLPQQYSCIGSNNGGGNNISFTNGTPVYALPYDQNSNSGQVYHHQSLFHHLQSGAGVAPQTSGPMALMPPPGEFFIWPNQSY